MTQNSPKPNAVESSALKSQPTLWAELEAFVPNTMTGDERKKKMLSDLASIAPLSFDDSSTAEEMSFSEKRAREVARISAQYVGNVASLQKNAPDLASLPAAKDGTRPRELPLSIRSLRFKPTYTLPVDEESLKTTYLIEKFRAEDNARFLTTLLATPNTPGTFISGFPPLRKDLSGTARFSMVLSMASTRNSSPILDATPIALPMKKGDFLAQLIKELNPSLNIENNGTRQAQEDLVRQLAPLLNLTPNETAVILGNNAASHKTLPLGTDTPTSAGPGF